MKQNCLKCGTEIVTASREGGMLIKSRAVLYDPTTGDARAVCPGCKAEVKIRRKPMNLVFERKK